MSPRRNHLRQLVNSLAGVVLISAGALDPSGAVAAAPTVGELLAVCDRAYAQGYQGLDAATCEWFTAPCACKPRDPDGGAPPWCVPDSEPIGATVRKVVEALRLEPDREVAAEPVVRAALTRLYPCASR